MEIVFNEFRDRFLSFVGGLRSCFSDFFTLENKLENEANFSEKRILVIGSGDADLRPIRAL